MTTHIKAITYEPKIPGVLDGSIRQTIRAIREGGRIVKPGDNILFHGWVDKPYRSKWSWRKEIVVREVINIIIYSEGIAFDNAAGDFAYFMADYATIISKTTEQGIVRTYPGNSNTIKFIAAEDGIVPATGEALRDVLFRYNGIPGPAGDQYQVIRW